MAQRLLSVVVALAALLALAFSARWLFGVDYFFNTIFVSIVGLGLSDVIYRWLTREAHE